MIVFIDESGDAGFSLDQGSSRIFVIACIVFSDELEAEKAAVAIKELKRKLKFSEASEFKFNGSRKAVRLAFFDAVRPYSFRIRALVVQKEIISSRKLKTDKNSFYGYFIKSILQHTRGTIVNAKIRIDGSGDRTFRRNFLAYLRKELNTKERIIMKNIRMVDSRTNVLIQLADMIAGAIRRQKEGEKADAQQYWDMFRMKIDDCWAFR